VRDGGWGRGTTARQTRSARTRLCAERCQHAAAGAAKVPAWRARAARGPARPPRRTAATSCDTVRSSSGTLPNAPAASLTRASWSTAPAAASTMRGPLRAGGGGARRGAGSQGLGGWREHRCSRGTHACTRTRTHTPTHIHTRAHPRTRTRTRTRTNTHPHTHPHTHAHARAHTHKHTPRPHTRVAPVVGGHVVDQVLAADGADVALRPQDRAAQRRVLERRRVQLVKHELAGQLVDLGRAGCVACGGGVWGGGARACLGQGPLCVPM
jgi:hypothetical protein